MIRDRRAILALLTGLNFLNYIDRAVIAAVLKPMKTDLGLSNFEAGVLATAFLIGFFATSPLFGARADKGSRKGLITLGVLIWSAATVASGLSTGFWSLLVCRVVVGVGEASFAVLAPTIIDDLTPLERKGSALSIFYLAPPLGFALGYFFGGTIAKYWELSMGHDLIAGWRAAFLIVGGPGILLGLSCLLIDEPSRKLLHAKARLIDGLRELAQIALFRRAVLGYALFTAAVSGFSFWAVDFLLEVFGDQLDVGSANGWFAVILVIAGTTGTLLGGRAANRALASESIASDEAHDSAGNKRIVNRLLRICSLAMAIAAPLSAVGFLLPGPAGFFGTSFVVQIALFATTAPVNAICLRAVPVERRASAMAAQIFAIHLFGDLWSTAALGLLLDHLVPKVAMMSLPLTFAWAAYVWRPRAREADGSSGTGASAVPQARVHTPT